MSELDKKISELDPAASLQATDLLPISRGVGNFSVTPEVIKDYIGAAGFTGSQGNIGFTGSQGIQGEQGIVGFTGSQGIQGEQGVIGFTGSQGVQGVIGFTGSQGVSVGGGDPWASYGTPAWRYDFNEASDLDDWTADNGSKSNALFRSSGGMYTASGNNLFASIAVSNVPFVFDVRARMSRPTAVTGGGVFLYIRGTSGSPRHLTWSIATSGSVFGDQVNIINRDTALGTVNANIVTSNQGVGQWPALADGVTMRCYYDGTNYEFILAYGGVKQVDRVAAALEPAASWVGGPVRVGFGLVQSGENALVEFAQYQTTNLDRWAGM